MLQITIINGNKITQQNNLNEPNPYRLLLDLVKQYNWPLDMVSFTRFKNGVSAVLDSTNKQEIVVQY
jgi:hypothetical protein